jgi:hypothetical protein
MRLHLFRRALDEEDRRKDQEAAGDGREPNVSKVVAQ